MQNDLSFKPWQAHVSSIACPFRPSHLPTMLWRGLRPAQSKTRYQTITHNATRHTYWQRNFCCILHIKISLHSPSNIIINFTVSCLPQYKIVQWFIKNTYHHNQCSYDYYVKQRFTYLQIYQTLHVWHGAVIYINLIKPQNLIPMHWQQSNLIVTPVSYQLPNLIKMQQHLHCSNYKRNCNFVLYDDDTKHDSFSLVLV